MTEKLRIVQTEYDQALRQLRALIASFFPDGLKVQVRLPYPHATHPEDGMVVGREANLLIRVALEKRGVTVTVPWEDVVFVEGEP